MNSDQLYQQYFDALANLLALAGDFTAGSDERFETQRSRCKTLLSELIEFEQQEGFIDGQAKADASQVDPRLEIALLQG